MALLVIKSGKKNVTVRISAGDKSRALDYSPAWCTIRKNGVIVAVATTAFAGFIHGTTRGHITRQVKLHEFIMGHTPKCKAIRFRDGDPLNCRRDNLIVYQMYVTENIAYTAFKKRKRLGVCCGCEYEKTCRNVAIGKKPLCERKNLL